jgi:hypothetical protein
MRRRGMSAEPFSPVRAEDVAANMAVPLAVLSML